MLQIRISGWFFCRPYVLLIHKVILIIQNISALETKSPCPFLSRGGEVLRYDISHVKILRQTIIMTVSFVIIYLRASYI